RTLGSGLGPVLGPVRGPVRDSARGPVRRPGSRWRVPRWVIVAPSTEAITTEKNVEVRRCAIESLGWDRFIAEAGLVPVTAGHGKDVTAACMPDPGNPGQHLVLYDVPERLWGSRIRLLMCTNGTAERDGSRRRYGLTVPAHISDP